MKKPGAAATPVVRALLALCLLPLSLSGCTTLFGEEAAEGCGDSRVHRIELGPPGAPTEQATRGADGTSYVYSWMLSPTGACRNEHVFIRWEVQTERPFEEGCPAVGGIRAEASSNPFFQPGVIPGSFAGEGLWKGEGDYGLKQAPGADEDPADYVVELRVSLASTLDDAKDDACAAESISRIKLVATDHVDE